MRRDGKISKNKESLFKRHRHAMVIAVCGLTGLVGLGIATWSKAEAGTIINVTTTDDELNSDGDCSLREAIEASNEDIAVDACLPGSGVDEIVIPSGTFTLTIPGGIEAANNDFGDLDITDVVTLTGAGSGETTIQGGSGWDDRIIHVYYTDGTVVQGVSIEGGNSTDNRGGGITNQSSSLTLNDVVFTSNFAFHGGGGFLNDSNSTASLSDVGFYYNTGGAILNRGSITIDGGILDSNTGPGLTNLHNSPDPANAILNDVEISRNTSDSGAGINNNGSNLTVTNSLIYYNAATDSEGAAGGGLYTFGSGTTVLDNVTITNNRANSSGGGIYHYSLMTLDMDNVTITHNIADYSSLGDPHRVGGGIYSKNGAMYVNNTIIAGNSIAYVVGVDFSDCYNEGSSIGTKDYNIQGVKSSGIYACDFNGPHSIQGTVGSPVDPLLGPLQDNGGPTRTHALLSGSTGIDTGNPADCPATDQRGVIRPQDGNVDGTAVCDIGAYEAEPAKIYLPLIMR